MTNLRTFKVTKSAGVRLGTAEQIASGPIAADEPVLILQYSYWTNKRRYATLDKDTPKQSEYRVDGMLALKSDIEAAIEAVDSDKAHIAEPWQWIVEPADRHYIYASKTGSRVEEVKWWKSRLGKAENTYHDTFMETDVVDVDMEKPVKGKMYFPRVYKLLNGKGEIDITDKAAMLKTFAKGKRKPIYFEVVGEKALSNIKFNAPFVSTAAWPTAQAKPAEPAPKAEPETEEPETNEAGLPVVEGVEI